MYLKKNKKIFDETVTLFSLLQGLVIVTDKAYKNASKSGYSCNNIRSEIVLTV